MARLPPLFARDADRADAAAEFLRMVEDVGEEGAHLLAELTELRNFKTSADMPDQDASTVPGLFIRYLRDWAVFYVADEQPFEIVVLHAARYRVDGYADAALFRSARDEALGRMKSLKQEGSA